jgi:hypothetical protein
VLRFTNDDVLRQLEGVWLVIRQTALERTGAPPSLALPRKGGGNRAARVARPARSQGEAP